MTFYYCGWFALFFFLYNSNQHTFFVVVDAVVCALPVPLFPGYSLASRLFFLSELMIISCLDTPKTKQRTNIHRMKLAYGLLLSCMRNASTMLQCKKSQRNGFVHYLFASCIIMNEKKFQTIFGLWINKTFSFLNVRHICSAHTHTHTLVADKDEAKTKTKKNSHSHRIDIITAMIFKFWFKFKFQIEAYELHKLRTHSIRIPLQQRAQSNGHFGLEWVSWCVFFASSPLAFAREPITQISNGNNNRNYEAYTHDEAHGLCFASNSRL